MYCLLVPGIGQRSVSGLSPDRCGVITRVNYCDASLLIPEPVTTERSLVQQQRGTKRNNHPRRQNSHGVAALDRNCTTPIAAPGCIGIKQLGLLALRVRTTDPASKESSLKAKREATICTAKRRIHCPRPSFCSEFRIVR